MSSDSENRMSEQQPTDPMERNRNRWRALAEEYRDVLKSLEVSLEGLMDALYAPRDLSREALLGRLKVLEDRIAEVLRGDKWWTAYKRAVQEAEELSKRATA